MRNGSLRRGFGQRGGMLRLSTRGGAQGQLQRIGQLSAGQRWGEGLQKSKEEEERRREVEEGQAARHRYLLLDFGELSEKFAGDLSEAHGGDLDAYGVYGACEQPRFLPFCLGQPEI